MTRPPRREGATPSPNIWHHPATYEIENRAADPHGRIEAAMASVASWDGVRLLDVGLRQRLPPPALGSDGVVRHRGRTAP